MQRKTLIASSFALLGAATTAPAMGADLTISCGAVGAELEFCEQGVAA